MNKKQLLEELNQIKKQISETTNLNKLTALYTEETSIQNQLQIIPITLTEYKLLNITPPKYTPDYWDYKCPYCEWYDSKKKIVQHHILQEHPEKLK